MADELIQTQILGVHEKPVNTRNGAKIVYEIQTQGDGNTPTYTTWDEATATAAKAAVGSNVTISVSVKQNGNYINRYLNQIIAVVPPVTSHIVDQAHGSSSFPASFQPVVAATPQPNVDLTVKQADLFEDRKSKDIHRQVACKVAAHLVQPGDSQIDFWQNVDYLIRFLDEGVKPLAVALALDERAA